MSSWWNHIPDILYPINLLDIFIIAFALYKTMEMVRGTRAAQLVKGILVLFAISFISDAIGLTTVHWVLLQLQKMLIFAIPVIFAPELRKALAHIGRHPWLLKWHRSTRQNENVKETIDHILTSMRAASASYTGLLIAITREQNLAEYVATGIELDARVSSALLNNIFIVNTPLHDGAVVIHEDRIVAASCYLPLSENRNLPKHLGTRHRAAIGLSEESDAVVLIVSEETGAMSLAVDGKLSYDLSYRDLQNLLQTYLVPPTENDSFLKRWKI